jgi:hypothetical protein
VFRQDCDRWFLSLGQRDGYPVLDRLFDSPHPFLTQRFIIRRMDDVADIPGQSQCMTPDNYGFFSKSEYGSATGALI